MKDLREKLSRRKDSHKGENGKIGVIGGSKDFSGAPALNAEAALRSGSDLVKILTSSEVRDVVRSYSENFIVKGYDSDYFDEKAVKPAVRIAKWANAVTVGSGTAKPDPDALKEFVERCHTPLVVDSEAIEILCDSEFEEAVFTPHEAEAEAIRKKFGSLREFVDETGAVVVLKGTNDRVFTPEGRYENDTGHETMTVGGTGDLLAGLIASLISQGLDTGEAARLAVWINGKAGERTAEELGYGALATDIVEKIPRILAEN